MDIKKRAILNAAQYVNKHKPGTYRIKLDGDTYVILQLRYHLRSSAQGKIYHSPRWDEIERVDLGNTNETKKNQ